MSFDNENAKIVARYLDTYFCGKSKCMRYLSEDNTRETIIINTPHDDGVTYIGTAGGFMRDIGLRTGNNQPLKVEFITAVSEEYVETMNKVLSTLVLKMDNEKCYYRPDAVVEDVMYDCVNPEMEHIFLCDPFLWEPEAGFDSINVGESVVAFLYALPITEDERLFIEENGADAFNALLEAHNAAYFDLKRPSVASTRHTFNISNVLSFFKKRTK